MAINKILKFGSTATSILTDGQYAADPERDGGNQPGTDARSALINKEMLQGSTITSGVAEFMADQQGIDIEDTLTPAQISSIMANAVKQANISIPFGDNTQYIGGTYIVSAPEYDYTIPNVPQVISFKAISDNSALPPTTIEINGVPEGSLFFPSALLQTSSNAIIAGNIVTLIRDKNTSDWQIVAPYPGSKLVASPASPDYNVISNMIKASNNAITTYSGVIVAINIPPGLVTYAFPFLLPASAYSGIDSYSINLTAASGGVINDGMLCTYEKLSNTSFNIKITSVNHTQTLPGGVELSWMTIGG